MIRVPRKCVRALAFAMLVGGCGRDHVLIPGAEPLPPSQLSVEAVGSDFVTLRWTQSDSAEVASYNVYRQSQNDASFQLDGSAVTQRRTVANLQTGLLYAFQIAAVSSEGLEGPRSQTVFARPTILSIGVNGMAEVTSNPNVVVQITASGFNQARLAQSLVELPQVNYQNIPASGVISFLLAGGDGDKTVYAQFRDSGTGAQSSIVSDDILLDRFAQISVVTQNTAGAVKTAGNVIHFRLTSGETDGGATADIGNARSGIRLYDDGTNGDATAADGTYEVDYVVEATIDANDVPVTGRFTDRAGNGALPVQAAGLVTIRNPPPPVTLIDAIPQGGGRVLLEWSQSNVADFQSYRVWHAATSPVLSAAAPILDTTITVRTTAIVTVDGLFPGVTRHFLVEVVDAAGNATESNERSTVPTGPSLSGSRTGRIEPTDGDRRRRD